MRGYHKDSIRELRIWDQKNFGIIKALKPSSAQRPSIIYIIRHETKSLYSGLKTFEYKGP